MKPIHAVCDKPFTMDEFVKKWGTDGAYLVVKAAVSREFVPACLADTVDEIMHDLRKALDHYID